MTKDIIIVKGKKFVTFLVVNQSKNFNNLVFPVQILITKIV